MAHRFQRREDTAMRMRSLWFVLGMLGTAAALASGATAADPGMGAMQKEAPGPAKPPIRTTMQKLHGLPGGVPRGWKFTVPPGDAKAGHEAFVKFECFKCHAVKGEQYPSVAKKATDVGPDLSGMGGHHLAEYFAESIMNPNAVILTDEKGYTGQDGTSVMPDYSQSMTVRELVDLVAYLHRLREGGMDHMKMGSGPAKKAPMKMPGDSGHGAMGK
jgi:hypothetical protein